MRARPPPRAFAATHGWVVAGVFEDGAKSGATFVGRDGLFAMMAAADRGEFSLVLVEELSRLSRRASEIHGVYDELRRLAVDICTLADVRSGGGFKVTFRAEEGRRDV